MRVFIGIDLDQEIRAKIARFLEGVSGFAPEARWARPKSLHITLKFIGEQKAEQVEAIMAAATLSGREWLVRNSGIRIRILSDRKISPRVLDRSSRRPQPKQALARGIDSAVAAGLEFHAKSESSVRI